jgi:hypothetical protein
VKVVKLKVVKSCQKMENLPELVLLKIAEYLSPKECVQLSMTCKRFYKVLPQFVCFHGDNFEVSGPFRGHWAPYFDGPKLRGKVKSFRASVRWKDQGWGNRKGRLMVKLVRSVSETEKNVIAENNNLFGIADHEWTESSCFFVNDAFVKLAEPGDFYSFERNAGGGGGHSLRVEKFTVILEFAS